MTTLKQLDCFLELRTKINLEIEKCERSKARVQKQIDTLIQELKDAELPKFKVTKII